MVSLAILQRVSYTKPVPRLPQNASTLVSILPFLVICAEYEFFGHCEEREHGWMPGSVRWGESQGRHSVIYSLTSPSAEANQFPTPTQGGNDLWLDVKRSPGKLGSGWYRGLIAWRVPAAYLIWQDRHQMRQAAARKGILSQVRGRLFFFRPVGGNPTKKRHNGLNFVTRRFCAAKEGIAGKDTRFVEKPVASAGVTGMRPV